MCAFLSGFLVASLSHDLLPYSKREGKGSLLLLDSLLRHPNSELFYSPIKPRFTAQMIHRYVDNFHRETKSIWETRKHARMQYWNHNSPLTHSFQRYISAKNFSTTGCITVESRFSEVFQQLDFQAKYF